MDILHIIDSDDESALPDWDPAQWIAQGKIYKDVPMHVDTARRRILQLPPSIRARLPPKSMSISRLMLLDLPPIAFDDDPMDTDLKMYTTDEPTQNIEEMLPYLALPPHTMLRQLVDGFPQAWLDGNKSAHTRFNPEIAFPLWALTFWKEMLDVCEAKDTWLGAESWLSRTGKTPEEVELKLQVRGIWSVAGWHPKLDGFSNLATVDLAKFFSEDYLDSRVVDGMLTLLSLRARIAGDETLIIQTTFADYIRLLPPIVDGVPTGPIAMDSMSGARKYLEKYGMWFQDKDHKRFYTVLYRPPNHWTVSLVNFNRQSIQYGDGLKWELPGDFFEGLQAWIHEYHGQEFAVTDDLPCANQTDGFNCPIIAVNTIAHHEFGEVLWTRKRSKAMRMKAFCEIMKHALSAKHVVKVKEIADPSDTTENLLAVDADVNDELFQFASPGVAETDERLDGDFNDPGIQSLLLERPSGVSDALPRTSGAAKRIGETMDDDEQPKRKITKTSANSSRPARATDPLPSLPSNPFLASDSDAIDFFTVKPHPKKTQHGSKPKAAGKQDDSALVVGVSRAATAARRLRDEVKNGTFRPSAAKTQNFRNTCKKWDRDAAFEPTSKSVQCSTCKTWIAMKESYNTSRFREHAEFPQCSPPPPPPRPVNNLANFFTSKPTRPKPKERPQKISRPCSGLTVAYDEQVGMYLDRTVATGGGARAPDFYSQDLFKKNYKDLSEKKREQVLTAQIHGRTWRNDTSPGIMATFSTKCLKTVEIDAGSAASPTPCHECILVHSSRSYQTAINKPAPDPKNLRFVPHTNQNKHAGMLYARFQGLEALMSEDNTYSLERRYINHVLNGDFKDDKVFNGIIQAKILGKTREIKGLGNQNFKHDEDVDALFGLIHTMSPRAYPLRPLYDGEKGKWFIVGAVGPPIEVPDIDALHATLDELEKNPPALATKLRLWTLQIPLPRVPPLALAIMPIESKVKGPQLAEWQLLLMKGLISRGFRVTSSGGDGAAVERDCHRRLAGASKRVEFRIKHPDPNRADIVVDLWDLDGNIWTIIQDSKHGRKTFRNNAASGARGLILGNFSVYFEQMYTLAMQPGSPMYQRDWKKRDRMDDRAAARLFSADTLQQAAEDPANNLGLVVYLFVFGDFIDAYQSRTLSHHERAKIAIRTQLFLNTWRSYLKKAGYSEARHFISKEAFDISQILVNGLLGLIVIHRDHLGDHPCPLLPWFNASEPNEHTFSGIRDVSEDFTLQEAILIVPKLRPKLEAAVRTLLKSTDFKKQASGYSHTYFTAEDVDFALLGQMPTDSDFSTAYAIADEENNCLWSLLGIHPSEIETAPTPGLVAQPCPDPDFEGLYMSEDEGVTEAANATAAEELQRVVDGLKDAANISRAGDEELDACVMASVALSMDELARIENLPDRNPERFAEIQTEIANAMATQPAAFIALLKGIAQSTSSTQSTSVAGEPVLPPSSKPLLDISSNDLTPLVALRREHQTREARMGVRTYKSSGTYTNHKTGVEKPLTERQLLSQKMQAIVRRDQERGTTAGANRNLRWTGAAGPGLATGNAANAELAAGGRAKEAMKRRRTIFGKAKCISRVAQAGVGSASQLEAGSYGFVMIGSEILLARGEFTYFTHHLYD
ncbi:hypothetical protein B0H11DRAFT_2225129 [Mycena galericulata]|nr:hypothetical protein B0H11DRAFT_2225129 [Mycena galericulata]